MRPSSEKKRKFVEMRPYNEAMLDSVGHSAKIITVKIVHILYATNAK